MDALRRCLDSLARQSVSPVRAEEVLLLDSGTAPRKLLEDLKRRYPWIDVASLGQENDYFDAKMRGAELATGEVVVMCDSDCVYEPRWLEELLAVLYADPAAEIVTGENTTPIRGAYGLAMALTYLFGRSSGATRVTPAAHYDTNNVAFRREFLLRHPIPSGLPMYRGHHVLHARALRSDGRTIWRQPRARALHPLPSTLSYFAWRFLLLGDEALTIARYSRRLDLHARPERRPLRDALLCLMILGGRVNRTLQIVRVVLAEDPRRAGDLPLALPIATAALLLYAIGLFASYARPGHMLALHRRAGGEQA